MTRRFLWREGLCGLVWMAGALAVAAPPTGPRFRVSDSGDEVVDVQAKLVWRRCVEGMSWTGATCEGVPELFDHSQAQAHATRVFRSSQLPWRLPHVPELKRLIDARYRYPAVDPELFPHTPPQWHWSASVSVGAGGAFNPYNYGNIAQGRTPSSVNQVAFLHGWAVDFANGESKGEILKRTPMVLRLVRVAR